jgi:ribosome-associated heat shock protein Hsp15
MISTTRIDKWLWAARFFKTRSMAARACELSRVEARHQFVKPAREVRVGELLQIRTEGGDFEVEVLGISDVRGPASVAQTLYRETEASKEARRKIAEERKAFMHFTPAPTGRPSKRDRRKINKFRGRI